MLKTNGIPMWVTIFALVVLLTNVAAGIMAIGDPAMGIPLAGRSIGLGLAAGAAVFLKSPAAYMIAFLAGIARDVGDLFGELAKPESSMGVVAFVTLFLILGIVGLVIANKARNLE